MRGCSRACEKIVLQNRDVLKTSSVKGSWWHKPSGARGAERICDIVRFMFVCKTLKDMATLLDLIRESPDIKVVRFKDRIENPSGSWRDAMINFRLRKEPSPFSNHICEVQIVHEKMALCRRKDGLGGHDEYVQQRNACETLEYLGEAQPEDKPASVREKQDKSKRLPSRKRQLVFANLVCSNGCSNCRPIAPRINIRWSPPSTQTVRLFELKNDADSILKVVVCACSAGAVGTF